MESNIEKLKALVAKCRVGMLGCWEDEETPMRFRPMSHVDVDDSGNVWFFTSVDPEKMEQLKKHPAIQLTYSCESESTYLHISGAAHLSTNKGKMKELFNPYVKAWFPRGLDDPEIALLVVRPLEVEYWVSDEKKVLQNQWLMGREETAGAKDMHGKMHV
ncbi:MAG TPA: pyridoxamine 5'-phosphate oxidase family protein [Chryseolinea sp.]